MIKNKIYVLGLVPVLFLVFSLFAFADSQTNTALESFQYRKAVSTPPLTEPTYVKAILDREVASSDAGYRDVRIFTEGGRETPYQLVEERARGEEGFYNSEILNLSSDQDGRVMFVLDLGESSLIHNRLDLRASNENYRREVSIYATNSLLGHQDPNWLLLTDDQFIFRHTDREADFFAQRGTINYPQSTTRYLRVVIEGGPEGALDISQARVYRHLVSTAQEESIETQADISLNQEFRATEILADLGSPGLPVNEVTLSAPEEGNFNRNVVVSGSNDRTSWRSLARSRIFRVSTPEFSGESMSISFPESSYRYYRISVINEDDQPLDFQNRVNFSGVLRSVAFLAEPGQSYYLYYGDPEVRAPRYDLARIFQYLEAQEFPTASLSGAQENPYYVPPPEPTTPFTERFPYLFNIVIIFLVIIVGFLIFFYAKKLKTSSTSSDPFKEGEGSNQGDNF